MSANAPVLVTVTSSSPTRPVNTALAVFTTALVPPSYTLLAAVMPDSSKALGVMSAVVVACSAMA